MKKIIASLLLSLGLISAGAQTAVTAALAPTPVAPIIVSPNAAAALASSSTNRIFLDQSGDNPNINMNQTGSGNRQGTANSPVYLRGIGQTVTTIQTGNNNEIDLAVVSPTTGSSVAATVMIQQIGNGNQVDASCGSGTSSDGATNLTGCRSANLNWQFTGNNNDLQYRATGEGQNSNITVSGNNNTFVIDSLTAKNSQTLMISGDNNAFNIKQTSTGANGSSALVDLTGSSNTINVTQMGSIDNVVNVRAVMNSGTLNITQRN